MLVKKKFYNNGLLPYLNVFFACCMLKFIRLLGFFNMKFVSDNFGILIVPSMIAGRTNQKSIYYILYDMFCQYICYWTYRHDSISYINKIFSF